MPTGQKLQRVSELQFFLYNRPLHPELFEIYHDHRIGKRAYEAHIWITGVSHLVGFYRGDAAITELLAESDDLLPRRGRLLAQPVKGEKNHEATHADGIRYMTSFQVERMSPRLFAKTHDELIDQGARTGLFVPFPEWSTREMMPFTHIDYEARANMLHLFAYHAFPEELTVIKTQSLFELT